MKFGRHAFCAIGELGSEAFVFPYDAAAQASFNVW